MYLPPIKKNLYTHITSFYQFQMRAGWGKMWQIGQNSPTASFLNASWLEENVANRAKLPNRKLSKCTSIGGKCDESGKTPHPQAFLKQAGWGKMWRIGQKAPTASFFKASWLEENVANRAKLPNCKLSKCELVGEKCGESKKTPQPQAF